MCAYRTLSALVILRRKPVGRASVCTVFMGVATCLRSQNEDGKEPRILTPVSGAFFVVVTPVKMKVAEEAIMKGQF